MDTVGILFGSVLILTKPSAENTSNTHTSQMPATAVRQLCRAMEVGRGRGASPGDGTDPASPRGRPSALSPKPGCICWAGVWVAWGAGAHWAGEISRGVQGTKMTRT